MIVDLFTTPLWITNLNTPKSQLQTIKEDALTFYKKDKEFTPNGWDCNVWTSHSTYDPEKKYPELCKKIAEEAMKFVKSMGYNVKGLKSEDFWINCGAPNTFQEFHTHSYSHISGVYYISSPENSGHTVFKNGVENMFLLPIDKRNEKNNYNTERPRIKPEDDKLIMFKSDLEHMVNLNKSNEYRVSMSFNFLIVNDDEKC